ncbi:MAG: septum formation initiator family protein [Actinobacteria bacterium]|nr:septum formation initiator family protein [Actinomycetota bacterium]
MARRTPRTDARPANAAGARGKRAPKRRRRGQRTNVMLRWCVLAAAVFVAFLYYQPLSSYLETRAALNERTAEVQQLRQERTRLQARLAHSATVKALSREARRMSLVRPGERLFIVKGVQEWRRAHNSMIGRNG